MLKIVYVDDLPKTVLIVTENHLLVGTGLNLKGDDTHERLCPTEGE